MSPEFRRQLETLINSHSIENGSNTPDYILARSVTREVVVFKTDLGVIK